MEPLNINVINITLSLQNVSDDELEVEIRGFIVNYNDKNYIISVHQGCPIKKIIINDINYDNFIVCSWCDLLIIPFNVSNDSFVFKHFVKKQMDPTDKYYMNSTKLKFIKTEFFEIGMIPNNPTIMYNCLKSFGNINTGMPIYNEKDKLAGIISKTEHIEDDINYVYCIPINYIITALDKIDNTKLYSLNEDISNIHKINNYKIICGKVYCSLHKAYIPVESYIAVCGDINSEFHITLLNGRRKKTYLVDYNNNMTNNNLVVNDNNIILTSGFLNLLKILEEIELIEKILINNETDLKWDKYNIV